MELLVPPRRLGRLLAQARVARGLSLDDVSDALAGRLSDLDLLEVETGRRPVDDQELQSLADLYDVETSTMVPGRSVLTVDLTEGVIRAGSTEAEVHTPGERQVVLAKYLALVYSMRSAEPGTVVPLRLADLDVLAEAFSTDRRTVEDELHELMARPEPVKKRFRLLRGRVMVPMVGVMVAATAMGTLVLVPASDSSAEDGDVAVTEAPANPDVQIGDAVVQERNADGTSGVVQIRS